MAANIKALVPSTSQIYGKIAALLPQNYFRFGFAYGSGVVQQGGVTVNKNPMIDMVFVVDDSEGFHHENLFVNPHHYSFLKHTGPNLITFMQEKLPARVYYNTLIPFKEEGVMFKYGIVNTKHFINDLLDWDYLYLAGRLHKPVKVMSKVPEEIINAIKQNLYSAVHAALIILPDRFTERQMYKVLANLSYNGDFRMIIGEDKNKVNNIVDKQILEFRRLYRPLLSTLDEYIEIPNNDSPDQLCMQDYSLQSRMYHLFQLPKIPQKQLITYWRLHVSWKRKDAEDVLKNIAHHPDLGRILSNCLRNVVFSSSVIQSVKGLFTAGFVKSIKYSNEKITKMIKSR